MANRSAWLLIAAMAVFGLANIALEAWLAYQRKFGIFHTEQEVVKICGKANAVEGDRFYEESVANWFTRPSGHVILSIISRARLLRKTANLKVLSAWRIMKLPLALSLPA